MKHFVIVLAVLLATTAMGQDVFEKVGTSGAHFLDISVDAAVKGMGDAYAAQTLDHAGAIHYNPATLVYIDGWSAQFNSVQYLADINLIAGGVAYNMGALGTFGVGYRSLNSGDIEETTVTAQNGTGNTYTWNDLALGLSYARSFTDNFSFGVNLNYVNEAVSAYDLKASAWSADLGTYYQTQFKSLRLGMTIRNFGPEIDFNTSFIDYNNGEEVPERESYRPFPMPLTFQVGVAYDLIEGVGAHRLTVAADAVHSNDSAERLNVGLEYQFANMLNLRGGFYTNHNSASIMDGSLMGGLGLNLNVGGFNPRFDYSVANYTLLGMIHQFSITISG